MQILSFTSECDSLTQVTNGLYWLIFLLFLLSLSLFFIVITSRLLLHNQTSWFLHTSHRARWEDFLFSVYISILFILYLLFLERALHFHHFFLSSFLQQRHSFFILLRNIFARFCKLRSFLLLNKLRFAINNEFF